MDFEQGRYGFEINLFYFISGWWILKLAIPKTAYLKTKWIKLLNELH